MGNNKCVKDSRSKAIEYIHPFLFHLDLSPLPYCLLPIACFHKEF